ncbi:ATP-dependent DNA helicase DinG [Lederbergia galactosidilyticus]|uniref:ATP-dependent DNA helicase DinG n=1 Tax=Lederbergia galactosidilytica TaxID=217031 RepID=UPI001AE35912|nr:ATP-dependent DNA helicase DinG [Lederbergia galactosidilytica]MBP1914608.1 ATP-dependent DNA helicase DinG [Lederbergia galactosidilytica]
MSQKYVVVDLETTGNMWEKGDRIIQLSAVVIQHSEIIDQYTTFINPGISIPPFIAELTGIEDGMVEEAPRFCEIAEKLQKLLSNAVFVAHNVLFDLGFLRKEMEEAGYFNVFSNAIDTVELTKILMPESPSYKLSELSDVLGFDHDRPHQADSDALVTAELLLMLIEKAKQLPVVTLEKLTELAFYLKSDIGPLFHELLKEQEAKIENLAEDLEVHRGIALKKKSFPINSQDIEKHPYPVTQEEKVQVLASHIAGFQAREMQFDMMDTIHEAFVEQKHTVIEAGTGTGKSLAYLLPALYVAIEKQQPVMISTYTTQMQEQILNNEIRRLEKAVSFPIQACIVKGRNHYINLLKFEQTLREQEKHYDIVLTKMQILVWLTRTETGDLDELNFTSGGHLFRYRIQHDGWFMEKNKDAWLSRDFYLFAREKALYSNIIITNHSMLLLDTEKDILPNYQYVIIDEAHHLERTARKCFGEKLEYNSVKYWIGRLGTMEKNFFFKTLETLIKNKNLKPTTHSTELEEAFLYMDEELDILYAQLSKLLVVSRQNRTLQTKKDLLRITNDMKTNSNWRSIVMCAERVYDQHQLIKNGLEERLHLIRDKKEKLVLAEQAFIEEMNSFIQKWATIGAKIKDIFISPAEENILWLQGDLKALPNSITIRNEPEEIGSILKENLFAQKQSVVLTSATLSIEGSLRFFLDELGLAENEIVQKIYPSPFKFDEMAKLLIPTDLPEIRGQAMDHDIEMIASHLSAIAEVTNGRMLILFTSYDMLKKTYYLVKDAGCLEDYAILAQGISTGSRSRLIKNFQQFNKAILFGTSSFWEGVDIPGKDLSCLIIVRLPFAPPDEPVTEAKYETIKEKGMNPFTTYALPQAVLRFKQGFGRLIRGEKDRGVVVVFDKRLDTTSYGKVFLKSIPPIPVEKGPLPVILNQIQQWLD